MFGFAPFVPPGKIQSIVVIKIFVVQIVVGGAGMPIEQMIAEKAFVQKFYPQMS